MQSHTFFIVPQDSAHHNIYLIQNHINHQSSIQLKPFPQAFWWILNHRPLKLSIQYGSLQNLTLWTHFHIKNIPIISRPEQFILCTLTIHPHDLQSQRPVKCHAPQRSFGSKLVHIIWRSWFKFRGRGPQEISTWSLIQSVFCCWYHSNFDSYGYRTNNFPPKKGLVGYSKEKCLAKIRKGNTSCWAVDNWISVLP